MGACGGFIGHFPINDADLCPLDDIQVA